jgi:triacylglycerol esterase/lipase EstA (alpha/beta hydrolase family)
MTHRIITVLICSLIVAAVSHAPVAGAQQAPQANATSVSMRLSATERPLVVIVHGYNSKPEEFDAFRGRLRTAGLACAVFSYQNDAAVDFSGRQLASALQALERQNPGRRVALVAHAMGGLLSRVVIEDPDMAGVGDVDQLITVATPNHGSNLARVPVTQGG